MQPILLVSQAATTPDPEWRVTVVAFLPESCLTQLHQFASRTGTDVQTLAESFFTWASPLYPGGQPQSTPQRQTKRPLIFRLPADELVRLTILRNERTVDLANDAPAIIAFDPWMAMPGLSELLTSMMGWGWECFANGLTSNNLRRAA